MTPFKLIIIITVAIMMIACDSVSEVELSKNQIRTRFGIVDFLESDGRSDPVESYNDDGLPIQYLIEYSYPIATYELKNSDVIITTYYLGNSCPGNFKIYEVKERKVSESENFGTCYDDSEPKFVVDGDKVIVTMLNLGGKGTTSYEYINGTISKKKM